MKKLFVILATILLVCTSAYALQDQATIASQVNVSSNFDLIVQTTSVDLGNALPGEMSDQGQVTVGTVSNTGNDWELRISNTPMTDGTTIIPDASCKVMFYMDEGAGDPPTGGLAGTSPFDANGDYGTSGYPSLPGAAGTLLYDSAAGEVGNFANALLLFVEIPGVQAAGLYQNQVTITMIEA